MATDTGQEARAQALRVAPPQSKPIFRGRWGDYGEHLQATSSKRSSEEGLCPGCLEAPPHTWGLHTRNARLTDRVHVSNGRQLRDRIPGWRPGQL